MIKYARLIPLEEGIMIDPSNTPSFRRQAFYERGHLYVPGNNVVVALQVQGPVSVDALRGAIPALRRIHPMIGVHLEFDDANMGWFVAGETPLCPVRVHPRTDANSWLRAVYDEYWKPFSISEGPLIRFLVIQGDSLSEVVAFAQHAICDG